MERLHHSKRRILRVSEWGGTLTLGLKSPWFTWSWLKTRNHVLTILRARYLKSRRPQSRDLLKGPGKGSSDRLCSWWSMVTLGMCLLCSSLHPQCSSHGHLSWWKHVGHWTQPPETQEASCSSVSQLGPRYRHWLCECVHSFPPFRDSCHNCRWLFRHR